ncbi:MAG: VOC family protein [Alicyclobacillus sp.]|nr:VOC family protein [Alicyclobacillus sp.]
MRDGAREATQDTALHGLCVKFASVPVRDQERALQFYVEKLGCKVRTDVPFGNGMRWIEVEPPGGGCGIVLFTPPGQEGRIGTFTNISFTCDDVEATYRVLADRGVEFVEPAKRADWGGMQAIFKDVDGNLFVLAGE